jgi:hypothetical protein
MHENFMGADLHQAGIPEVPTVNIHPISISSD